MLCPGDVCVTAWDFVPMTLVSDDGDTITSSAAKRTKVSTAAVDTTACRVQRMRLSGGADECQMNPVMRRHGRRCQRHGGNTRFGDKVRGIPRWDSNRAISSDRYRL